MQTIFKFSAPIKPVSVNQAVRHGKNGSYKSAAFKTFSDEMKFALSLHEKPAIALDKPVNLIIHFTLPKEEFFTKKGQIAKKHDLDNLQKYTIDSIANHLEFNDALITELVTIKIPGERWYINAEVRQKVSNTKPLEMPDTSDLSGCMEGK